MGISRTEIIYWMVNKFHFIIFMFFLSLNYVTFIHIFSPFVLSLERRYDFLNFFLPSIRLCWQTWIKLSFFFILSFIFWLFFYIYSLLVNSGQHFENIIHVVIAYGYKQEMNNNDGNLRFNSSFHVYNTHNVRFSPYDHHLSYLIGDFGVMDLN